MSDRKRPRDDDDDDSEETSRSRRPLEVPPSQPTLVASQPRRGITLFRAGTVRAEAIEVDELSLTSSAQSPGSTPIMPTGAVPSDANDNACVSQGMPPPPAVKSEYATPIKPEPSPNRRPQRTLFTPGTQAPPYVPPVYPPTLDFAAAAAAVAAAATAAAATSTAATPALRAAAAAVSAPEGLSASGRAPDEGNGEGLPKISIAQLRLLGKQVNADKLPPLSRQQAKAFHSIVALRRNVFVTGGAGTGKSLLLRHVERAFSKFGIGCAVTAPTGVAAINVQGMTINAFSGVKVIKKWENPNLPYEPDLREMDINVSNARRGNTGERWKHTAVLIIDEVSMLPGSYLQCLETVARRVRGSNEPFGGMQIVFFGDFLQLPPVKDQFCFLTPTWEAINCEVHVLTEIFRQTDPEFLDLLNNMRYANPLTTASDQMLRSLCTGVVSRGTDPFRTTAGLPLMASVYDNADVSELDRALGVRSMRPPPLMMRPTNQAVANINSSQLNLLDPSLTAHMYRAVTVSCDSFALKTLQNESKAELELVLKVGCRVMLIKNLCVAAGLANGSCGVVVGFEHVNVAMTTSDQENLVHDVNAIGAQYVPIVKFDKLRIAKNIIIEPEMWTSEGPLGEIKASILQIPLVLAWATTIHKAQGLTLDNVNVDLSGVFPSDWGGMSYVAISRARSSAGVALSGYSSRNVMSDPKALQFQLFLDERARLSDAEILAQGDYDDDNESLGGGSTGSLVAVKEEPGAAARRQIDAVLGAAANQGPAATRRQDRHPMLAHWDAADIDLLDRMESGMWDETLVASMQSHNAVLFASYSRPWMFDALRIDRQRMQLPPGEYDRARAQAETIVIDDDDDAAEDAAATDDNNAAANDNAAAPSGPTPWDTSVMMIPDALMQSVCTGVSLLLAPEPSASGRGGRPQPRNRGRGQGGAFSGPASPYGDGWRSRMSNRTRR